MSDWLERQRSLIGDKATDKLKESSVLCFGAGGVGSYAIEALARCGVGRLTVVDYDVVSTSNINRQIIANTLTVGKKKTDASVERIISINPECCAEGIDVFVDDKNAHQIIENVCPDYVIDAVDNVTAKLSIIEVCINKGIPVVSSMGTGNKLDPTLFKICDISKTSVCPLARVMRRELKKREIYHVDVLYSEEQPVKEFNVGERVPASVSFVPSVAGLLLARYVVLKLTENELH